MLALGELGSGKTTSVVVPLLFPLADASLDNISTGLVVDTTGELTRLLAHFPVERPVLHLRPDTVVLDLMAGPRWSLDADLAEGWWLTAAHRILCRVAALVPESPARALRSHARTDAGRLDCEGTALVEALLAFVLMTTSPDAPAPAAWLGGCPRACGGWRRSLSGRRATRRRAGPTSWPSPPGSSRARWSRRRVRYPGDRHSRDRHPGDRPPGDR